jgi:hypothetical protein
MSLRLERSHTGHLQSGESQGRLYQNTDLFHTNPLYYYYVGHRRMYVQTQCGGGELRLVQGRHFRLGANEPGWMYKLFLLRENTLLSES